LLRQPGLDSWNPNAVDQDFKTDAYHLGRLLFLIWKESLVQSMQDSVFVCLLLGLFVKPWSGRLVGMPKIGRQGCEYVRVSLGLFRSLCGAEPGL
jgi:hypothetical protein